MQTLMASPWLTLSSLVVPPLLVIALAYLCHRAVPCPRCGAWGRYYVGFFCELRTRVREIGPVCCKHCQTRFVFLV